MPLTAVLIKIDPAARSRLPSFYLRIGFDLVTDEALKAREEKEAMEALAVEGVAAWSARQEQEFKDDSRQCISL